MLISRFSPVCICLQDTVIGESTRFESPGYRAFFSTPFPGQGHQGGTAIFIHNDIPFIHVQIYPSLQVVALKVFVSNFYSLCSLFLSLIVPVERNELDNLLNVLPSLLIL